MQKQVSRRIAALVAASLLMGFPLHAQAPPTDPGQGSGPDAKYHFSQDFMARAIPVWTKLLAPYRGQKNLRYLEVGVFEGRSFVWMLDNILTHRSSQAWALDLFDGPFYDTFLRNLLAGKHTLKTRIRRGDSREILPTLEAGTFDIIYIDGNHEGQYVLSDAVMAWQLLENGGLLIFDDYRLDLRMGRPLPPHHLPGGAIDAFITTYAEDIVIVHDGYQKAIRKRPGRCDPIGCSAFGQYSYQWYTQSLTRGPSSQEVKLDEEETQTLEFFLRSRLPGETRFSPDAAFLASPAWKQLSKRLQIRDLNGLIVSADEVREHRSRKPDDAY